jgi:shikimate kinase
LAGNLVLVGFMGSGKSTVGPLVAGALGVEFIDLDQRIEEMTGKSIEVIFEEQGEARFRSFESANLARALAGAGQVIAVGGGAVMDDHNWTLIRDANVVVRLRASDEATLERLASGELRPLAGSGKLRDDPEAAGKLLRLAAGREPRYAQAEHQVDTTGREVGEVAAEITAIAHEAGVGGAAAGA